MHVDVGTAPDSWGVWFADDPKQPPWQQYLDEAAAGYRWTELGPVGYLPTDLPTLRRELDRRDLRVCSAVVMHHLEDPDAWPAIERDTLQQGALLQALGARHLVLIDDVYRHLATGEPLRPARLSNAEWRKLVETAERVGRLARDRFGLTTVFHPHAETHVETEDQIDSFLAQTDPALVSLCLDTGHHAYRGGDPVAFLRRHHRRVPYLHLKSVDPGALARVDAEQLALADAVGQGVFCEPAQGMVDFPAFRDVLREIDYDGFAVVEQDMYPVPFDRPLPIARRTRLYLRDIGIG